MAAAVGLVAAGCTGGGGAPGPGGPVLGAVARLVSFDSCDELLGWFRDEAGERVTAYGLADPWDDGPVLTMEDALSAEAGRSAADGAEAAASVPTSTAGGQDFSTTNVQEAGVGEPDLAVTDGRRLLSVVGGDLRVVDLTGAEPVVTATVELGDAAGQLLVEGDHAVVLSQGWADVMPVEPDGGIASSSILPPGGTRTVLTRVDLDGEPRVVGRVEVAADLVDARMVDGVVRVVTRARPDGLGFVYPGGGSDAAEERALAANRDIVASSTLSDWLPELAVARGGRSEETRAAVACDAVDRPARFSGFDVVTVVGLDLRAGGTELVPSAAVVAGGGTVYASTDSLYVTTARWPEVGLGDDGVTTRTEDVDELIGPGEDAAGDPTGAGSADEPIAAAERAAPDTTIVGSTTSSSTPTTSTPTTTVPSTTSTSTSSTSTSSTTTTTEPTTTAPTTTAPPPPPDERGPVTDVHAFDISGRAAATYVASGRVRGTVLDQFSLSEHEGRLRIATTVDPGWWGWDLPTRNGTREMDRARVSESFVTVLERNGDTLERVGEVGGLGLTEQIYSARFVGDLAYVVTFRRTDPLYVVDLRDPTAPTVAGELKINGYSSYLQLVDEGRLLGVGQDGTDDGRLTGFAESLFDVSDPTNPTRLAQLTVPDGSSLAEQDHHALLWWPATDTLVVPIEVWGPVTPLPEPRLPVEPGDGPASSVAPVEVALPQRGVLVTTVADAGITERGRLAHPATPVTGGGTCPPEADCAPPEPFVDVPTIERSLVVGDRLLTLSAAGVMANDLATLEQRSWTPFA